MEERAATLQLLGPPRARLGSVELRFPDRKGAALLALLALDGPATRARIASLLWDEQADSDVRRNLRRTLHRMRDAGFDALLDAGGDTLALRAGVAIDSVAFEAACAGGEHEAAVDRYPAALLQGFEVGGAPAFDDWLSARRDALAQRWRASAELLCDSLRAKGQPRAALALAGRLLAADTLHEAHYRRAMSLHATLGEREAALAVYERCRKALGRELGLRPLPQTVDLAEHIRSGNFEAAPRPTAAMAANSEPVAADTPAAVVLPQLQTLPATAPLVGREAQLAAVLGSLRRHRLTLLAGVAGIGKSRLLHEVLAQAGGLVRVHDSRISDRHVPYAAVVRWLRAGLTPQALSALGSGVRAELALLLPGLGPAPAALTSDTQRLRLYEALREAWEQAFEPGTLHAFDDWQFVDAASAQWWGWWLGQALDSSGRAAQVLVSERPGEALAETAQVLLEALAVDGAATVHVQPLSGEAVYQLVQWLSATQHPQRFAHRLWQATGGHPFYLLETLQHLLQSAVIRVDERGQWHTPFDDNTDDYHELPVAPSVQAAVMLRLQALDEATRRLLEAASLTGDDFSLALVSGATALDEWEAVHAIEAALHARVLSRVTVSKADNAPQERRRSGRFRFEHDLFAQAVSASLSAERRALMHRALGLRLAQEGAAAARVAEHFDAAGDTVAACTWHLRALDAAQRRLVPADMLLHAQRVRALAADDAVRVRAWLAQAKALYLRADANGGAAATQQAAELTTPGHPLDLRVSVAAAQAQSLTAANRPADALPHLSNLLGEAALDGHQRARLLISRGGCLRTLGRGAASQADLDEALRCLGDEPSVLLADLLDDLARNAITAGDFATAHGFAQRSAQVAEANGSQAQMAAGLTMCGVALLMRGHFTESVLSLERARAIAAREGLVAHERGAILNLASAWLALGERALAMAAVDAGFALSRHFASPAEKQAFAEARYQCRVDAGELGAAFEGRDQVIEASLALSDIDRRVSGLLVTLDLPLTLDDATGGLAPLLAALHSMEVDGAQGAPEHLAMTHAKAAWHALVAGQLGTARGHLAAAGAAPRARPESLAYVAYVEIQFALAQGDLAHARAVRQAFAKEGVSAEVWALVLSAALRVPDNSEAADHWAALAHEALSGNTLPALSTLLVIDALGAPLSPEHQARGEQLAESLHGSLHARPHEQTLFARRFVRWLRGS